MVRGNDYQDSEGRVEKLETEEETNALYSLLSSLSAGCCRIIWKLVICGVLYSDCLNRHFQIRYKREAAKVSCSRLSNSSSHARSTSDEFRPRLNEQSTHLFYHNRTTANEPVRSLHKCVHYRVWLGDERGDQP